MGTHLLRRGPKRVSADHMYSVATGPHIPPLNERHLQVNRSGVWYDLASFIAPLTWLGSRMACLWRSSRFGAFSTARTFASHILTMLVRVCVRKGGGVGAR